MRFLPDPGTVDDVDFIVGVGRMSLLGEYRNVFETNAQELRRLHFAILIMGGIGSRIESPTFSTLENYDRIAILVALNHALEVKILSETGRALIGCVGEDHASAETTWDLVYDVADGRHFIVYYIYSIGID